MFAHGQAYVPLSRVRNLEGVMLTGLQVELDRQCMRSMLG